MSELADLAERPLVAALSGRLQALHRQLQVFVERVDSLGGAPVGDRDPQVEGASPQTLLPEGRALSLGAAPSPLPLAPADPQDKVSRRKHTLLSLLCCECSSYCFGLYYLTSQLCL